MKILVIEDNPRLVIKLKQQLSRWYTTDTASSGDEGLRLAMTSTPDIVILDLNLPDMNGLQVCESLRQYSLDIPILILTGIDTVESTVSLLESGADDYLTKPFEVDELRARINALSRRRSRHHNEKFIRVADLTIDPGRRTVERSGVTIPLRRKEYDILEYLATHPGRVLSRQMIIDHAWENGRASWVGSVDVHIKQLRDKVDRPFRYPLIKTSYGVGYMIDTSASDNAK